MIPLSLFRIEYESDNFRLIFVVAIILILVGIFTLEFQNRTRFTDGLFGAGYNKLSRVIEERTLRQRRGRGGGRVAGLIPPVFFLNWWRKFGTNTLSPVSAAHTHTQTVSMASGTCSMVVRYSFDRRRSIACKIYAIDQIRGRESNRQA